MVVQAAPVAISRVKYAVAPILMQVVLACSIRGPSSADRWRRLTVGPTSRLTRPLAIRFSRWSLGPSWVVCGRTAPDRVSWRPWAAC